MPHARPLACCPLVCPQAVCRAGHVFRLHAELAGHEPKSKSVQDVVRWLGLNRCGGWLAACGCMGVHVPMHDRACAYTRHRVTRRRRRCRCATACCRVARVSPWHPSCTQSGSKRRPARRRGVKHVNTHPPDLDLDPYLDPDFCLHGAAPPLQPRAVGAPHGGTAAGHRGPGQQRHRGRAAEAAPPLHHQDGAHGGGGRGHHRGGAPGLHGEERQ